MLYLRAAGDRAHLYFQGKKGEASLSLVAFDQHGVFDRHLRPHGGNQLEDDEDFLRQPAGKSLDDRQRGRDADPSLRGIL